jgi:transketolase
MRNAALETIGRLIETDSRVVFVGSDLGAGTLDAVRAQHPDRVLMEGIAEQHLVSFAAGLALEGFLPYVHTIATFLTRRAFEQIAIDVALDNLPVILLGAGGGMVYAPLGPTHQAIDDFSLMRSIPGLAVVAPADPMEIRVILEMLCREGVPAYVRVGKGGEPEVTGGLPNASFGKMRLFFEGEKIALVTTGALLHECIAAAEELKLEGLSITLAHFPFVSPIDRDAVRYLSASHDQLFVVEEHIPQGGLASAISEVMSEIGFAGQIHKASLPNSYATKYGTQKEHWGLHGIDANGIKLRIAQILSHSPDQEGGRNLWL